MASTRWRMPTVLVLVFALCGFVSWSPARAECGGRTECIGIGATFADAKAAHHGGTSTFTLDFGNQPATTTSAVKLVYVAAVTGPAGTVPTLGPFTIAGANASDFRVTSTDCAPGVLPTQDAMVSGSPCTISVTFNPGTTGTKSATLHVPLATPCAGCITERTLTLAGNGTSAPAPTAGAANITTQVNTALTVDLSSSITGSGVTGIAIATVPAHGTATVSGTRVTYTPYRDYFGSDSFTYTAANGSGTSAPATVTVTISGRPDPAKDVNVLGLLGAQARAARRFSLAQATNIQQRMESLHRRVNEIEPRRTPDRRSRFQDWGATGRFSDAPIFPGENARRDVAAAPPPSVHAETGLLPASTLVNLLGSVATGSLNLSAATSGGLGSGAGMSRATGTWIGGIVNFGTREQTADSPSSRYATDGITAGFDRRASERFVYGMGIGAARDHTDIGTDGTHNDARGQSIALYGSYQPSPSLFVDSLIGYGVLDLDMNRFVTAANDTATARRPGRQTFASLAVGYNHQREGVLVSPYGRLDVSSTRLGEVSENGAGAYALTYFEQSLRHTQIAAGLRAEALHETRFGWALPRLRVEVRRDLADAQAAMLSYADLYAGLRYSAAPGDVRRNTFVIGAGNDLLFHSGLKVGFDYQVLRSPGLENSQTVRLVLAKELDGKDIFAGFTSPTTFADPVRVEASFMRDDNLTRAGHATDRRADAALSGSVGKNLAFPLSTHTRLVATGFVSGEKFRTYTQLDRSSAGAQAELRYRNTGEFYSPTFGLFARGLYDSQPSEMRNGRRISVGLNVREALTDRIDLFAALSRNLREAKSDVFDTKDSALRITVDYALSRTGVIYGGGEYRRGDAVSSGQASAGAASIARALAPDDAWPRDSIVAYRFDASTIIWTTGYNLALGPRDGLDFSWRRVATRPVQQPDPAAAGAYAFLGGALDAGAMHYVANQYALTYLMRF